MVITIIGLVSAGLGAAILVLFNMVMNTNKLISGIKDDHVRRSEFEAHRNRTMDSERTMAASEATMRDLQSSFIIVQKRLDDVRMRLVAIEKDGE